jgi:hypothetical protein
MERFNGLALAVLFITLIRLEGCQDLVPHDTHSLLMPTFQRSEILGFVAGFGTHLRGCARLGGDAQAPIKCRDKPENGGNYGSLSALLDLLRLADCFAACDRMEPGRSVDQFLKRWRLHAFRAEGESQSRGRA